MEQAKRLRASRHTFGYVISTFVEALLSWTTVSYRGGIDVKGWSVRKSMKPGPGTKNSCLIGGQWIDEDEDKQRREGGIYMFNKSVCRHRSGFLLLQRRFCVLVFIARFGHFNRSM